MGEAPGTNFANVSLSPDNQDLKPSPLLSRLFGQIPCNHGVKDGEPR